MVNFTMLAHNRPRLTKQALASLENTQGANITIYNNGLDDFHGMDDEELQNGEANTSYWVTVFCAGRPNAWTFCGYHPNLGTGESRNMVIKASEETFGRGDYLYLSDNDVFFKPGWLETLIRCYEAAWEYGCRVIGGVGHPYHQPYEGLVQVGDYGVHAVHAQPLQSMLMKWEVWDKYGPFCKTEPGRVCQSEDVDFTNKIIADGGKIGVVSPALIVNTGITNSFGEHIPGWELVKSQCPEGVLCE